MLESNPILEAFGNAKTVRNDNSSRFGKWIQIWFDDRHCIAGASITSYLLERSRIVTQSPGERNYHIFYQLLSGLDPAERAELGLTRAADFALLRGGGAAAASVAGIDDGDDCQRVRHSLRVLGLSQQETAEVFRLTAALLHLGNVQFADSPAAPDAAALAPGPALATAARLLRVDAAALEAALLTQRRSMGKESVVSHKSRVAAEAGLLAAIKTVYAQQFEWIVQRINQSLQPPATARAKHFVGVLDIFGFEVFESNYFEQLCINFTNESMQAHFNQHVFRLELDAYKADGVTDVDTASVGFIDNQGCLDMIEKGRQSVFALVDDEIRTPKGSDAGLLDKLHSTFAGNGFYSRPKLRADKSFVVKHYAGEVEYNIEGFLAKNKDTVELGVAAVLAASASPLLSAIMKQQPSDSAATAANTSVVSMFKRQLQALVAVLSSCEPHFIRCIKSNLSKSAGVFDGDLVLKQLRYLGLRDVVLMRQQGFPIRIPHGDFAGRYRALLPAAAQRQALSAAARGSKEQLAQAARDTCQGILALADPARVLSRRGLTLIFLRAELQAQLEAARDAALSGTVLRLQCAVRMWLHRRRFLRVRAASRQLSAAIAAAHNAVAAGCSDVAAAAAALAALDAAADAADACSAAANSGSSSSSSSNAANAPLVAPCVPPTALMQALELRARLDRATAATRALLSATAAKDAGLLSAALAAAAAAKLTAASSPALAAAQSLSLELATFAAVSAAAVKSRALAELDAALATAARLQLSAQATTALAATRAAVVAEQEEQQRQQQAAEEATAGILTALAALAASAAPKRVALEMAIDRARRAGVAEAAPELAAAVAALEVVKQKQQAMTARGSVVSTTTGALLPPPPPRHSQVFTAPRANNGVNTNDHAAAAAAAAAAASAAGGVHSLPPPRFVPGTRASRPLPPPPPLASPSSAGAFPGGTVRPSPSPSPPPPPPSKYSVSTSVPPPPPPVPFTARGGDGHCDIDDEAGDVYGSLPPPPPPPPPPADDDDTANPWDGVSLPVLESSLAEALAAGVDDSALTDLRAALASRTRTAHAATLLRAAAAAEDESLLTHALAAAAAAAAPAPAAAPSVARADPDFAEAYASAADAHARLISARALRSQRLASARRSVLHLGAIAGAVNSIRAGTGGKRGAAAGEAAAAVAAAVAASAASAAATAAAAAAAADPRVLARNDLEALAAMSEPEIAAAVARACDPIAACTVADVEITVTATGGATAGARVGDDDGAYALSKFPHLRDVGDFAAKASWFRRDTSPSAMLAHTTHDLPATLTRLDKFNPATLRYRPDPALPRSARPDEAAREAKYATSLFKTVQAYMLDRKLSFADALVAELLLTAHALPQLRDELYAQIMKQLTLTPTAAGFLAGWRLLCLCCLHFAPSLTATPFVVRFIMRHLARLPANCPPAHALALAAKAADASSSGKSSGVANMNSSGIEILTPEQADYINSCALYCSNVLPRTLLETVVTASAAARTRLSNANSNPAAATLSATNSLTAKDRDSYTVGAVLTPSYTLSPPCFSLSLFTPPPLLALSLLDAVTAFPSRLLRPGLALCHFPDGSALSVRAFPWDSGRDVARRAAAAAGMTDLTGLALYESVAGACYELADTESPLDVLQRWELLRMAATAGAGDDFESALQSNNTNEGSSSSSENEAHVSATVKRSFFKSLFKRNKTASEQQKQRIVALAANNSTGASSYSGAGASASELTVADACGLPLTDPLGRRKLLVRKRVSYPHPPTLSPDPVHNLFVFHQTRADIEAGLHHLHLDSAAMLAFIVCHLLPRLTPIAHCADRTIALANSARAPALYPPAPDLPASLAPRCPLNLLAGPQRVTPPAFAAATSAVSGVPVDSLSPEQYVMTAAGLPTFGAVFFPADGAPTLAPALPPLVMLGVNSVGVFLLHGVTREPIASYPLQDVLSWALTPLAASPLLPPLSNHGNSGSSAATASADASSASASAGAGAGAGPEGNEDGGLTIKGGSKMRAAALAAAAAAAVNPNGAAGHTAAAATSSHNHHVTAGAAGSGTSGGAGIARAPQQIVIKIQVAAAATAAAPGTEAAAGAKAAPGTTVTTLRLNFDEGRTGREVCDLLAFYAEKLVQKLKQQ